MKLSPFAWVILLIGIIGVAAAAVVVTVTITGTVKVVSANLTVSTMNLAWGSIMVNATHSGSATLPLTIQNTGQVDLIISVTCSCQAGFTISISPPLTLLVKGAPGWVGSVTLNVAAGTAAGDYTPSLIVTGSI